MQFLREIRHSCRGLLRTPGVTGAVVLSAAAGIGANAAVFGFLGQLDPAALAVGGQDASVAQIGRVQTWLAAAALCVVLLSMTTVGGVLLSRAAARLSETAVRIALGARMWHVARPLLADALVVAGAGAALGVLMAWWATGVMPALLYAEDAESLPFRLDVQAVGIATVASGALIFVSALAPLLRASGRSPIRALRSSGRRLSRAFTRWRSALVAGQLAVCCLVLVSIGTVVAHVQEALRTDAGRRAGAVLMTNVRAAGSAGYFGEVKEALGDWPATFISVAPPGGRAPVSAFALEPPAPPRRDVLLTVGVFDPRVLRRTTVRAAEGRLFGFRDETGPPVAVVNAETAEREFGGDPIGRVIVSPEGRPLMVIGVATVTGGVPLSLPDVLLYEPQGLRSPGYLAEESWNVDADRTRRRRAEAGAVITDGAEPTLAGYTLVDGRGFQDTDDGRSAGVALVNVEAADLLFAGNAIGGAVTDPNGRRATIVGVVRATPFRTFQPRAQATVYFPMAQRWSGLLTLVTQAPDSRSGRQGELAARLDVLDDGERITDVVTLDEHLHRTALAADRIVTMFLWVFVVLAVGLSAVGASGAIADTVTRRTHEIALRSALGASRRSIVTQVLTSGVQLALAGTMLGLVLFAGIAWFTEPLTTGARGPDGWWWLVTPAGLLAVVLLASAGPAMQALNIQPASLIRE